MALKIDCVESLDSNLEALNLEDEQEFDPFSDNPISVSPTDEASIQAEKTTIMKPPMAGEDSQKLGDTDPGFYETNSALPNNSMESIERLLQNLDYTYPHIFDHQVFTSRQSANAKKDQKDFDRARSEEGENNIKDGDNRSLNDAAGISSISFSWVWPRHTESIQICSDEVKELTPIGYRCNDRFWVWKSEKYADFVGDENSTSSDGESLTDNFPSRSKRKEEWGGCRLAVTYGLEKECCEDDANLTSFAVKVVNTMQLSVSSHPFLVPLLSCHFAAMSETDNCQYFLVCLFDIRPDSRTLHTLLRNDKNCPNYKDGCQACLRARAACFPFCGKDRNRSPKAKDKEINKRTNCNVSRSSANFQANVSEANRFYPSLSGLLRRNHSVEMLDQNGNARNSGSDISSSKTSIDEDPICVCDCSSSAFHRPNDPLHTVDWPNVPNPNGEVGFDAAPFTFYPSMQPFPVRLSYESTFIRSPCSSETCFRGKEVDTKAKMFLIQLFNAISELRRFRPVNSIAMDPSRRGSYSRRKEYFQQPSSDLDKTKEKCVPFLRLGIILESSQVFVDSTGWLQLIPFPRLQRRTASLEATHNSQDPYSDSTFTVSQATWTYPPRPSYFPGTDAPLTTQWKSRLISNLDYLLAINRAAGRISGNYTHAPILPWVTDFTSEIKDVNCADVIDSPWRDLSKSKYRIKKGERQLQHTFEHGAHHIPEPPLSSLSYLMLRARATPVSVLKHHVRSDFVGHHYPSTMERIYSWSPEESCLEFYTCEGMKSIMSSKNWKHPTYSDLDFDGSSALEDIKLPPWCFDGGVERFVYYHRSILEGDVVSQHLHLWIDLTFGVALEGNRAADEMNVPLRLHSIPSKYSDDDCRNDCHTVDEYSENEGRLDGENGHLEQTNKSQNHNSSTFSSTLVLQSRISNVIAKGGNEHSSTIAVPHFLQVFHLPHPHRSKTPKRLSACVESVANSGVTRIDGTFIYSPWDDHMANKNSTLLGPFKSNSSRELFEELNIDFVLNSPGSFLMCDDSSPKELLKVVPFVKEIYYCCNVQPPTDLKAIEESLCQSSLNTSVDTEEKKLRESMSINGTDFLRRNFPIFDAELFCVFQALYTGATFRFLRPSYLCDPDSKDMYLMKVLLKLASETSSELFRSPTYRFILLPLLDSVFINTKLLVYDLSANASSTVSPLFASKDKSHQLQPLHTQLQAFIMNCCSTGRSISLNTYWLLPRFLILMTVARDECLLQCSPVNQEFIKLFLLMMEPPSWPELYSGTVGEVFCRTVLPFLLSTTIQQISCYKNELELSGINRHDGCEYNSSDVRDSAARALAKLSGITIAGPGISGRYILPPLIDAITSKDGFRRNGSVILAVMGMVPNFPSEALSYAVVVPILHRAVPSRLDELTRYIKEISDKSNQNVALSEARVIHACRELIGLMNLLNVVFPMVAACSINQMNKQGSTLFSADTLDSFFQASSTPKRCKTKHREILKHILFSAWNLCRTDRVLSQRRMYRYSPRAHVRRIDRDGSLMTQESASEDATGEENPVHRSAFLRASDEGTTRQAGDESSHDGATSSTVTDASPYTISSGTIATFHTFTQQRREASLTLLCQTGKMLATLGGFMEADDVFDILVPILEKFCARLYQTYRSKLNRCKEILANSPPLLHQPVRDNILTLPGMTVARDIVDIVIARLPNKANKIYKQCPSVEELKIWIVSAIDQTNPVVPEIADSNDSTSEDCEMDSNGSLDEGPGEQIVEESKSSSKRVVMRKFKQSKKRTSNGQELIRGMDAWVWTLGSRGKKTEFVCQPTSNGAVKAKSVASFDPSRPWKSIGRLKSTQNAIVSSMHCNPNSARQADGGSSCMACDSAESILLSGTAFSEVLLWDLKRYPTEPISKISLRSNFDAPSTTQLSFINQISAGLALSGSSVFLLDLEKERVVSQITPSIYKSTQIRSNAPLAQFSFFESYPANSLKTGSFLTADRHYESWNEIITVDSTNIYSIDMRVSISGGVGRLGSEPILNKSINMQNNVLDGIFYNQARRSVRDLQNVPRALDWLILFDDDGWGRRGSQMAPHAPFVRGQVRPSTKTNSLTGYTCVSASDCGWFCAGTSNGYVYCWERRKLGSLLHCWCAHHDGIVRVQVFGRHHLLTVGHDGCAHMWDLLFYNPSGAPAKISTIKGLPSSENGLRMQNIAIRPFSLTPDTENNSFDEAGLHEANNENNLSVLYAASKEKAVSAAIPHVNVSDGSFAEVKVEAKAFRNRFGKELHKNDLDIQSILLLPLRQMLLLGTEDTTLPVHVCL